jgi:predicted SnoaL-like aldol condensation-catalyzing enzyme
MTQHEAETNKAIVDRLYEAFRAGEGAALGEVLAEDFINHNPRTTNGLTASQALFSQVGSIDADIHRMICEGNLVAVHAHYKTPADQCRDGLLQDRARQDRGAFGTSCKKSRRRQLAARTCSAS